MTCLLLSSNTLMVLGGLMRYKYSVTFYMLIILTLILGSCTPNSANNTVTPTESAAIATANITLTPTPTVTATLTPTPSATPRTELPASTPIFAGTSIPASSKAINSENIQNLTQVAQWGHGTILGVVFTPDGSQFIVASAFGFAIYNADDLLSAPTWVPFNSPINFTQLVLSEDGNYLQLSAEDGVFTTLNFPSGQVVDDPPELKWINSVTQSKYHGEITVDSPDGTKQLRSFSDYDENDMDIEYSYREIYDTLSGTLLYTLPDETFYLRYNDSHQPEGCDLDSIGVCGNAYSPIAYHPYEASFSPSEDTLTILYSPSYGNTSRFNILRIYDAENGKLIDKVGSFEKPIQTFAYEPNSNSLLIAFVDGSIQLREIFNKENNTNTWHFNDNLTHIEFTSDGKYLLLQRPDLLEVRSMQDGSISSIFDAVSYALSPIDSNLIAIADNNVIKIIKIDSGETILSFRAHDYAIFTITFSPDGKYIVSSGQDCKIKLWDAKTGEFLHFFDETIVNARDGGFPIQEESDSVSSRIFIYDMDFIKGTNQIVGFGSWGAVVNWDVNSGATNYAIYSVPNEFSEMTFDSRQLHIDDKLYNLETGELIGEYKSPENKPDGCEFFGPKSTDGNLLFTLGFSSNAGQVCVLDAHGNHLIQLIKVIPHPDYELKVTDLALSQDGKTLIIATTMGTVNVYQIVK
ncbi:MAG: hypothetical protein C0410_03685 [Anaerolinea sp.]|nr:hypothetical protein [Anaerolinea sp.]